jgi:hypothetical protein
MWAQSRGKAWRSHLEWINIGKRRVGVVVEDKAKAPETLLVNIDGWVVTRDLRKVRCHVVETVIHTEFVRVETNALRLQRVSGIIIRRAYSDRAQ